MSLLNRVAGVSVWSTCPRANVPNACQLLLFTYQRANEHANQRTNQPKACDYATWRAHVSTWRAHVAKGVTIFQLFLPKSVLIF